MCCLLPSWLGCQASRPLRTTRTGSKSTPGVSPASCNSCQSGLRDMPFMSCFESVVLSSAFSNASWHISVALFTSVGNSVTQFCILLTVPVCAHCRPTCTACVSDRGCPVSPYLKPSVIRSVWSREQWLPWFLQRYLPPVPQGAVRVSCLSENLCLARGGRWA